MHIFVSVEISQNYFFLLRYIKYKDIMIRYSTSNTHGFKIARVTKLWPYTVTYVKKKICDLECNNTLLSIFDKRFYFCRISQYIEYWDYCSSSSCSSVMFFPPSAKHLNMAIGFVGVAVFGFVWILRCYVGVIFVLF